MGDDDVQNTLRKEKHRLEAHIIHASERFKTAIRNLRQHYECILILESEERTKSELRHQSMLKKYEGEIFILKESLETEKIKCSEYQQLLKSQDEGSKIMTQYMSLQTEFDTFRTENVSIQNNLKLKVSALEADILSHQGKYDALNMSKDSLTQKYETLKLEYEIVSKEKSTMESTLLATRDELRVTKSDLESVHNDLNRKFSQFELDREQWEIKRAELQAHINKLVDFENRYKLELIQFEKNATEMTEKLQSNELEITRLKLEAKSLRKAEADARKNMQNIGEDAVQSLQRELTKLRIEYRESETTSSTRIAELESQLSSLQAERVVIQRDLQTLRVDYESRLSKMEGYELELEKRNKEIETLQRKMQLGKSGLGSQLSLLGASESMLKEKLRQAELANTELRREKEGLEFNLSAQMKLFQQARDDLEGYQNSLQEVNALVDSLQKEKFSLTSSLSSVSSELELYRSRAESLEQDLLQRQNDSDRQRRMFEASRVDLEAQVLDITQSEHKLKLALRKAERTIMELNQRIADMEEGGGARVDEGGVFLTEPSVSVSSSSAVFKTVTRVEHVYDVSSEHARDRDFESGHGHTVTTTTESQSRELSQYSSGGQVVEEHGSMSVSEFHSSITSYEIREEGEEEAGNADRALLESTSLLLPSQEGDGDGQAVRMTEPKEGGEWE